MKIQRSMRYSCSMIHHGNLHGYSSLPSSSLLDFPSTGTGTCMTLAVNFAQNKSVMMCARALLFLKGHIQVIALPNDTVHKHYNTVLFSLYCSHYLQMTLPTCLVVCTSLHHWRHFHSAEGRENATTQGGNLVVHSLLK